MPLELNEGRGMSGGLQMYRHQDPHSVLDVDVATSFFLAAGLSTTTVTVIVKLRSPGHEMSLILDGSACLRNPCTSYGK